HSTCTRSRIWSGSNGPRCLMPLRPLGWLSLPGGLADGSAVIADPHIEAAGPVGSDRALMLARPALLVPGHLGGVMGHRKRLALVVVVMLIGIVEGFEKGFLLVMVVLIHLACGQVGNLAVGHR